MGSNLYFSRDYCLPMFLADEYELIDFGGGRRLERLGDKILDRPCPAADGARKVRPSDWNRADLRFWRTESAAGKWEPHNRLPDSWLIELEQFRLELRPTEFGHVGVFPEQADNWRWISDQVGRATRPLRVLNLFGYTGAASLAASSAGAQVTHVDAARSTVSWARINAKLSGLNQAPIRWIAEDARKFTERELRRGRQYDAAILDPPSYGHGSRGRPWKIEQHLPDLLAACAELTKQNRAFILLTCHTAQLGPRPLSALLAKALSDGSRGRIDARTLVISTQDGRCLDSGTVVRWEA